MNPEQNPYLKIEDPFQNFRHQHDSTNIAHLELMRLCWNVFHANKDGQRLMELLKKRYFENELFNPAHPQAANLAIYWAGFREAIRGLLDLGLQHQQYVNGVENSGKPNTTTGSTGS